MDDAFELGRPALVCRWRLAGARLPLENRHLRALAAREPESAPVTTELVAWAKQHLEWNLHEGASAYPDGVLMLVVDEEGRAAMSVGPYEGLADESLASLVRRAEQGQAEARVTCVAPETLWLVREGKLYWWPGEGCERSGAASLVEQLSQTMGYEVEQTSLCDETSAYASADEVFLVSDEHGVVVASDAAGPIGARLHDAWKTLLERTRQR